MSRRKQLLAASFVVLFCAAARGADFQWIDVPNVATAGAVPLSMSGDGSTLVMTGFRTGYSPYLWNTSGTVQPFANTGFFPGAFSSDAAVVSNDGSQVVGISGPYILARWTAPGDIEVLQPQSYFPQIGILPNALSLDGGTIVGTRTSQFGYEAQAVRWTSFGDGQPLGTLPGDAVSSALAVSA